MSWTQRGVVFAVFALAVLMVVLYTHHAERFPGSDDAYVDADVVQIAAQVAGPLTHVPVTDNAAVRAGDLLFEIDPRPFRIAVDKARAELDKTSLDVSALAEEVVSAEARVRQAKANLRLAEVQWKRIEPLAKVGAVPFQDRDKALANLEEARSALANAQAGVAKARFNLGEADQNNADVRAAVAELEDAELKLSYARVVAPVNGYVTDLTLSPGSYADVGSPMLALVNTDSWHITAYLRETQLRHIRVGQTVRVHLPAYPDKGFEGHVQGIGWGVEQQDGAGARGADGLPTVEPTVDWVRMAQRFPVRITLRDVDPERPLRKGMRASVRVDASQVGGR